MKKRLKELLKEFGVYYYMPVPGGYGMPALDFICCLDGFYFQIETKAGKKDMTPRQKGVAKQVEKAGGKAFLINEDTATWDKLLLWLTTATESARNITP